MGVKGFEPRVGRRIRRVPGRQGQGAVGGRKGAPGGRYCTSKAVEPSLGSTEDGRWGEPKPQRLAAAMSEGSKSSPGFCFLIMMPNHK